MSSPHVMPWLWSHSMRDSCVWSNNCHHSHQRLMLFGLTEIGSPSEETLAEDTVQPCWGPTLSQLLANGRSKLVNHPSICQLKNVGYSPSNLEGWFCNCNNLISTTSLTIQMFSIKIHQICWVTAITTWSSMDLQPDLEAPWLNLWVCSSSGGWPEGHHCGGACRIGPEVSGWWTLVITRIMPTLDESTPAQIWLMARISPKSLGFQLKCYHLN